MRFIKKKVNLVEFDLIVILTDLSDFNFYIFVTTDIYIKPKHEKVKEDICLFEELRPSERKENSVDRGEYKNKNN